MKQRLAVPYAFNPTTRQITLTGMTADLASLLVIIDQNTGQILYAVGVASLAITTSGSTITLNAAAPLAGAQSTDTLFMYYEPALKSPADRSGLITLGAQAQTIALANLARQGFEFQNDSPYDLWLSTLTTAVPAAPSLWLPPGTYWKMDNPDPGAISLYGGVTGQAFTAREWSL